MTTDPRDDLEALAQDVAERYGLDPEDFEARVRRQLARRIARGAQPVKGCPVCLRDLPALAFAEDPTKGDGLKVVCRECMALRERVRRRVSQSRSTT